MQDHNRGIFDVLSDSARIRTIGAERKSVHAVRRELRDQWLRTAADALARAGAEPIAEGAQVQSVTTRLIAAVIRFERGCWPAWKGLEQPPPGANEVERALFFARRYCGDEGLPRVARVLTAAIEGRPPARRAWVKWR